MAYLLENVIFVTKNEDMKENLVSTFKQFKNSNIITQVDPAKFMDEQFIAGFCRRGVVTVLPLKPLPEFHLSIEKSVLTLDMSPVIYSGFGLSAKRMKQGKKQFFYRLSLIPQNWALVSLIALRILDLSSLIGYQILQSHK
uniref:Uncharacterized protein n=1 Tax=Schistosoma japonicum TaxID=6182 RepID=C1LFP2_SCHJA|nr:hypothetical protein [Schistosoma japonicum]